MSSLVALADDCGDGDSKRIMPIGSSRDGRQHERSFTYFTGFRFIESRSV